MLRRPSRASCRRPRSGPVFTAYHSTAVKARYLDFGSHDYPIAESMLGVPPADFADTFIARPQTRLQAFWSICSWKPKSLLRQDKKLEAQEQMALCLKKDFLVQHEYPKFTEYEHFTELQHLGRELSTEDMDPKLLHREPTTETQTWKASQAIQDLTRELLHVIYRDVKIAITSLDSGFHMIRMLQNEGFPRYKHPEVNPRACMRARYELNEANRRLMERWNRRYRISLLTKMCHNLLVCEYLPGIQNYNTLIVGFIQLGEYDLAQAVVDMYLFKSHLRPTRTTILALLQHYRLKRDKTGFRAIIRRLVAHDPRGLHIRRRKLEELSSRVIHNWAHTTDISAVDGYMVERAALDLPILEAILRGFLDLKEVVPAAKMFAVCLHEEDCVNIEVFSKLLSACLAYIDHDAARIIMQGILSNVDRFIAAILDDSTVPVGLVRKLRQLVVLCASHVTNTETSSSASLEDRPLPKALERLTASLWAKATWSQLFLWRDCISRLKNALESSAPLLSRVETAISALDRLSNLQHSREVAIENYASLAKVSYMTIQMEKSSAICQKLERQILNFSAVGVERQLRGVTLFDISASLDKRLSSLRMILRRGTWLNKAAACFDMSRALDDRLRWAILDALPIDLAERTWGDSECVQDLGPIYLQKVMGRYLEGLSNGKTDEEQVKETRLDRDPFVEMEAALLQPKAITELGLLDTPIPSF